VWSEAGASCPRDVGQGGSFVLSDGVLHSSSTASEPRVRIVLCFCRGAPIAKHTAPPIHFAVGYVGLDAAVWNECTATRCDCRSLRRQGWGTHDGRALESILYVVNDENFAYTLNWMKQCIYDAIGGGQDVAFVEAFCRSGLHRSVAMVVITVMLLRADGFSATWECGSVDFWRTWKLPCTCPECNFEWTPVLLESKLGLANWSKVRTAWGDSTGLLNVRSAYATEGPEIRLSFAVTTVSHR
jgi:hypothetical protein